MYTASCRTWTSQNDVELSSDAVSEADAALSSEGSFVASAWLTYSFVATSAAMESSMESRS